jgi:hypothetical protein
MAPTDPSPHQTLARLTSNQSTWANALEFAVSEQNWSLSGFGNPFHIILENANPRMLVEVLDYKAANTANMPLFLKYGSVREEKIAAIIAALDLRWITQTREIDGATPLHRVFVDIAQESRWFKPQDARMNGHLCQFADHAEALSDAWKLAALFNLKGGDFIQPDRHGACLAQLIVEADHSLNPEYRVSKERQSLRKLEAFWQAALLEKETALATHACTRERL